MSSTRIERTRRTVLLSSVALIGLAGCSGGDDDSGDGASNDGAAETTASATETQARDTTTTDGTDTTDVTDDSDETATGTDGGLDLREANVVGVEFDRQGSQYTFDVSLHHDDGGEDGYANWWQVERLDGSQIGRRVLTHPHSNQPFTRSDSFEIGDATCVVVRGHDETHGYGGRAALVNLESGAMRTVEQGSDRQSFSESDCP